MDAREPSLKIPIPAAGDAARKAGTEGDAINEAHGIRVVPRGQYLAAGSVKLRGVGGIRGEFSEEPKPDLSTRTAADYLPPQFKARLIAEGRLAADGTRQAIPKTEAGAPERGAAGMQATGKQAVPTGGVLAGLSRFFRKLF